MEEHLSRLQLFLTLESATGSVLPNGLYEERHVTVLNILMVLLMGTYETLLYSSCVQLHLLFKIF